MQTIDPATLSRADAIAMRDESARQNELCRLAAGLAKGKRKRQFAAYASQHLRNAMAIDDYLASDAPQCAPMTDDELLAELTG